MQTIELRNVYKCVTIELVGNTVKINSSRFVNHKPGDLNPVTGEEIPVTMKDELRERLEETLNWLGLFDRTSYVMDAIDSLHKLS